MASQQEFVQYLTDQMQNAGCITYRKMFGEYGLYCNGKIFALVCDDQLFIKITDAGHRLRPELAKMPPYAGAKDYFLIEDIDDSETLVALVTATCEELSEQKPRKRKRTT
ncbi:MAG: TfoX/Sxy family protein [Spirochaetia bacterium]|jgi:TfoX/Sxy family transcriptional regulator of competence genes|nr:TfoX/Sxy family protein [Spirochaetia bacterium]